MKKAFKLKLICLVFSIILFGCGQTPAGPPQTEKRFTDKDLDIVEEVLDLNLKAGNIKPLISGVNKIIINVPKAETTLEFMLDIPTLTTRSTLGSITANLNNLAFKSFTMTWDGMNKSTRLRADFHDKKDGIVGEINLGGLRGDLVTGVSNAHIDILFFPKVINGDIAFDNPKIELGFDLEGINDPKAKQTLMDGIQKSLAANSDRINESFRKQEDNLKALVKSNFEKGVRFLDIIIEAGSATVKIEFPGVPTPPKWDVTQDGAIDIFDLVNIGIHFGEKPLQFAAADVNSDSEVDIFDLVTVAQHFGESTVKLSPQKEMELQKLINLIKDPQAKEFILSFISSISSQNQIKSISSALFQNYPNPFNPETWIPYQLKAGSEVTIRIYNANGRLIRRLVLGYQEAGYYLTQQRAAYWDGRDELGGKVPSGIYFYHLRTDTFSAVRKMTIIK